MFCLLEPRVWKNPVINFSLTLPEILWFTEMLIRFQEFSKGSTITTEKECLECANCFPFPSPWIYFPLKWILSLSVRHSSLLGCVLFTSNINMESLKDASWTRLQIPFAHVPNTPGQVYEKLQEGSAFTFQPNGHVLFRIFKKVLIQPNPTALRACLSLSLFVMLSGLSNWLPLLPSSPPSQDSVQWEAPFFPFPREGAMTDHSSGSLLSSWEKLIGLLQPKWCPLWVYEGASFATH